MAPIFLLGRGIMTRRKVTYAVFLGVGTLAFAVASLLPFGWNFLAEGTMAVLAYFVGNLLLWSNTPETVVLTPALEVPTTFQWEPEADSEPTELVTTESFSEQSPSELIPIDLTAPELPAHLDTARDLLKLLQGSNSQLLEVQSGADSIRENLQQSYQISENLTDSAQQAFDHSARMQERIKVVTHSLRESMHHSRVLYDQSVKIAKILELMSEMSDKIHILSINASIVSARAGIHGRGFEVVAKEIRQLAKDTDRSLEETEEVIGHLQSTISTVIYVVSEADKETDEEQKSLVWVAGSLQSIILGAEIIRAMSSSAKQKFDEISIPSDSVLNSRMAELTQRLQNYLSEV
jgi:methyl-accepting chemotaxis protein